MNHYTNSKERSTTMKALQRLLAAFGELVGEPRPARGNAFRATPVSLRNVLGARS